MSVQIDYDELGQIDGKVPLEAFYEAMLPVLKNYGLTAEFPADKPSLEYSISGIEFDVLIGAAPNAVRYQKWQQSPYSMGGLELMLESGALVHKVTGAKLSFQVFITDYLSGMTHPSGTLWLTIKFSGAGNEVNDLKKAIAPVLEKYRFQSVNVKNSPVAKPANAQLSVE